MPLTTFSFSLPPAKKTLMRQRAGKPSEGKLAGSIYSKWMNEQADPQTEDEIKFKTVNVFLISVWSVKTNHVTCGVSAA